MTYAIRIIWLTDAALILIMVAINATKNLRSYKRNLKICLEESTVCQEKSETKCERLSDKLQTAKLHVFEFQWFWRPFYLLHDAEYVNMKFSYFYIDVLNILFAKYLKYYASTHRLTMGKYVLRIFTVCIMCIYTYKYIKHFYIVLV